MIYEWKCKKCGKHQDVQRSVQDRDVAPDGTQDGKQVIVGEVSVDYAEEGGCASIPGYEHQWVRVYNSSVPFTELRDKGIFMDENGNYPPRKMD